MCLTQDTDTALVFNVNIYWKTVVRTVTMTIPGYPLGEDKRFLSLMFSSDNVEESDKTVNVSPSLWFGASNLFSSLTRLISKSLTSLTPGSFLLLPLATCIKWRTYLTSTLRVQFLNLSLIHEITPEYCSRASTLNPNIARKISVLEHKIQALMFASTTHL